MATPDYLITIASCSQAEFKDRGSRFIANACPLEEKNQFKDLLKNLKKEHPSASHHCFAYRTGTDRNNFRVSDDGEPSGTAGRSIMGQIECRELTNLAVFVTRYFGGSLLGTTGLIRAYKTSAALALQMVPFIRKPFEVEYSLEFDYTQVNEVMGIVKDYNCRVISQEIQLFCKLRIAIPSSRKAEIEYKFANTKGVEFFQIT